MIDLYLKSLIKDSLEAQDEPSPSFCEAAYSLTSNLEKVRSLQNAFTLASKQIFLPSRVSFIIKYDMIADDVPRQERIKLMSSWKASKILEDENMQVSPNAFEALEKILDSELHLARGPETSLEVLYHRTRSFAYTFMFFLKDEFLDLMTPESLQYACDCALAAVIMDDADDVEEDFSADSPTFFTHGTCFTFGKKIEDKASQGLHIINFLQNKSRTSNILDILSRNNLI